MSATIQDVADRAKVSVATVSRALRGLPNVAPSTRQRVLTAARDLAYIADPSAARLATGQSRTIGLAVPMLDQWFHAKLFSGVEAVSAASGYDVLPFSLAGRGGVRGFVERLPFRKRVDGLVLVDVPFDPDDLLRIQAAAVPLVTVGLLADAASSLTVDNVAAARLAVGHLAGLGHRRIGLVGGVEDDPFRFSVPVDRYGGYLEALASAGLQPDPRLTVPGNFSLEGGAEAMHDLLALDEPPTAVFCCSDEMAIGAMQSARDAGLRIPGDLSVVGFDDHDVSEYLGLTTIRQDVVGLGERAAALLLERLADPTSPPINERHPTRLIVRHTTGPPPPGLEYRW